MQKLKNKMTTQIKNKLEEIFIKKGEFADRNGIKIKNFIYCGEISLDKLSKKMNSSQLYEFAERIKQGKKLLEDFNAFLIEQPKDNFGKLFGIIPPKYFRYHFKFYKI